MSSFWCVYCYRKRKKYRSGNYFNEYDSNKSGGKKVGENFGLSCSAGRTSKEVNQNHLTNSCKYNRYHMVFLAILSINIDALYPSLLIVLAVQKIHGSFSRSYKYKQKT